jgi:hypothetical protein
MSYPYIIQGSNVTVVIDGKPHAFNKSHLSYSKVVDAIKRQDWATVKEIVDPVKVVLGFGQGNISVQGDTVYWKDQVLHNSITKRIVSMINDGFDIEPMVRFMDNLMQNPSKRAVDELYGFLEKNSLPLTPDGHFLAYKKIRFDYTDCHTGKMDNSVGKVVEMERNQVDDDQNRACSTGLHFCSYEYLNCFGGDRIVIVKINPRDVVSIPVDYNNSKGRACRYEVVDEIDKEKADEAFALSVQEKAKSETSVVTKEQAEALAALVDAFNKKQSN